MTEQQEKVIETMNELGATIQQIEEKVTNTMTLTSKTSLFFFAHFRVFHHSRNEDNTHFKHFILPKFAYQLFCFCDKCINYLS